MKEDRIENLFVLKPINPEFFASYIIFIALSLVSEEREFSAFTADPTLTSFRAGRFLGDENGCNILARPGAA